MSKVAKTIAIAPRNGTVGTSTPGGHIQAWRALKALPQGKVVLALAQNPWRAGTPGGVFCQSVLMPLVAKGPYHGTVASLLAAAAAAGYTGKGSMGQAAAMSHLVWLYTWGVGTFTVNGLAHGQSVPAAKPARKARKAKAAPAQVVASEQVATASEPQA